MAVSKACGCSGLSYRRDTHISLHAHLQIRTNSASTAPTMSICNQSKQHTVISRMRSSARGSWSSNRRRASKRLDAGLFCREVVKVRWVHSGTACKNSCFSFTEENVSCLDEREGERDRERGRERERERGRERERERERIEGNGGLLSIDNLRKDTQAIGFLDKYQPRRARIMNRVPTRTNHQQIIRALQKRMREMERIWMRSITNKAKKGRIDRS